MAGKNAPPAAAGVTSSAQPKAEPSAPVTEPSAAPSQSPAAEPTPTPTPAASPAAVFDFTQPVPESEPVEMDYFSDALFIGDSRTDGLQIYSGIKGADFYCYKGLNIFDMSKRQVVEMNGGKYTVVEALKKGPQYKKIYISLGINELGWNGTDTFRRQSAKLIERIQTDHPEAVLVLQSILPPFLIKTAPLPKTPEIQLI